MIVLCRAILILTAVGVWSGAVSAAEMQANAVFLVARRGLTDPNFSRTVVLVTHPREGGPWGVVINRPLDVRLAEVLPEYEALKGARDLVYAGGPVARNGLVFLIRSSEPLQGATPVLRDVYFAADPDLVDRLLRRADPMRGLRAYSGYSGWAAGQLQREIARGGWYVLPADAETVFDKEPARIWPELIDRASTRQTVAERALGFGDGLVHTSHRSRVTSHAFWMSGANP